MLEETRNFYEKLKLEDIEWNIGDSEMPVEFVHIFKKSYPRLSQNPLPKVGDGYLQKILQSRESIREFSDQPMSLEEISRLLNSCSILDYSRDPERRTYPSAGARFPIEIYMIGYNIEGLNKGAYHFNVDNCSLETLLEKDLENRQGEIMGTNIINPAATLALTSVISRSEVKYRHKALPFSYLEAGHMGQNIVLSAAENGIGACPVSGFVDDALIQILDLTEGEIPVYTINVGKRKE
ncbi:MAG: SagB/ThcOx family dehydrogenase [Candidatus Pacearchaeota archaeon]